MQVPTVQTFPQRPQFAESVASVTSHPSLSKPLQSAKPATHAERPHIMLRQRREACATARHDTPQPPQLFGSKRRSAHEAPPSHVTSGAVHAGPHCPIEHTALELHGIPQPPQWRLSVAVETHSPKQKTCPTPQRGAHPPATQRWVGWHITPHPPQLRTSRSVLTQAGPHDVVPGGHAVTQVLPRHSAPGAQGTPHPPQFIGSTLGSTHEAPHLIAGVGQAPIGTTHFASMQPPVRQSRLRLHAAPKGHGAQGPPQSTSLSSPFATWSVQVGARHRPAPQRPL